MQVQKQGLLFAPPQNHWWNKHYAILPTPLFLPDSNSIRIYYATTCDNKYGRISYIDVDANNPSTILYQHHTFILDVGEDGTFDDCGVNPSAMVMVNGSYYLYYAGYQRHHKTPYSILSGVAVADNPAGPFTRLQQTPILERTPSELSIRSAPTIIQQNNLFYMVYVANSGWMTIDNNVYGNKPYPVYNLSLAQSTDGVNWQVLQTEILNKTDDEFGYGRPYLVVENGLYHLFYSVRRINQSYRLGYATSSDLKNWLRQDELLTIQPSPTGWDSQMVCYPSYVNTGKQAYLFYNGNQNGLTGFGWATISL